MFAKFSVSNCFDESDSTGLNQAQKTALTTAWGLIKSDFVKHAVNISAMFYEQSPEHLRLFDDLGNDALHRHSEDVLQSIGTLIDEGLRDEETFHRELHRIAKFHNNISRQAVMRLTDIIKVYVLKLLAKHQSKSLVEALETLLSKIESKFEDPADASNEEL